jgi:hypothetical protein
MSDDHDSRRVRATIRCDFSYLCAWAFTSADVAELDEAWREHSNEHWREL